MVNKQFESDDIFMKLAQLLQPDYLVPQLHSADKESVLRELLSHCELSGEDIAEEVIYDELLERETEQTTGIGEGIAFPHARLSGLTKIHIIIGTSVTGVEFNAMDRKPVHFIVMILVDRAKPNELLMTRAAIAKLLFKPELREGLLQAQSSEEMLQLIAATDITVDYEVTAKDIMRPCITSLPPDATIGDAARELHRHHIDSLPIIDQQKKFYGEISCYDLFSYGLPDFFNSLHVISFVKHMNPFEKYFHVDNSLRVADLLAKKSPMEQVIAADATLMEIIFEMTVKNKEFLYVLSPEGKLRGLLDRYSIIDKILMAR